MHKGCTREAQGGGSEAVLESQEGGKEGMPSAKARLAVLGGCGVAGPRCPQSAMRAPLYISARIRESGGRISDGNYNR